MAGGNRRSLEVESAHFRGVNNNVVLRTMSIEFIQIVCEARNEVIVDAIASKIDGDDCANLLRLVYMRELINKLHSTV